MLCLQALCEQLIFFFATLSFLYLFLSCEHPKLYNNLKYIGTPSQAEQRAREESERLRKEEREQIAEKRRRDLVSFQMITIL